MMEFWTATGVVLARAERDAGLVDTRTTFLRTGKAALVNAILDKMLSPDGLCNIIDENNQKFHKASFTNQKHTTYQQELN